MKQFFEQYGGVALGILALLVLIVVITPVGNIIKTSLQGTVHKFSSSINTQTDDMTNQMTNIMNSAGDFLNVKEDGKMYKGDVLYTGWNGDKAYLNGIENEVKTNLQAGNVWVWGGHASGIRSDESFTDCGLDPNDFEIISFKIDDVILGENYRNKSYSDLKVSLGVSTFETIVMTPSIFDVTLNWSEGSSDFTKEVISDDGIHKITVLKGTITSLYLDCDVNIDDLYFH